MTRAQTLTLPILSAAALILTACGSGDPDPVDEPMTQEQINQVLLPLADFPGEVEVYEEHFGESPWDPDGDDQWLGMAEYFGGGECVEALDSMGGIDGENQPVASGERWAGLQPPSDPEDPSPTLRVRVASYQVETSVDASWDELHERCDGETIEAGELDERNQQITLEAADLGEFRGFIVHWEWDEDEENHRDTGYVLSSAQGRHVISVTANSFDEETVVTVLSEQLDLLHAGPETQDEDDDEADADRHLPDGPLSQEELTGAVLDETHFPLPISERVYRESGEEIWEAEYPTWHFVLMGAIAPAATSRQDEIPAQCRPHWEEDLETMFEGPAADAAALFFATKPELRTGSDSPAGAAVLLQSYSEEVAAHDTQQLWKDFLEGCAGQFEHERGTTLVEEYAPYGGQGFYARGERENGEELTSYAAYFEFGHTTLHVVGIGISEDEMDQVITAQLENLEQ
ncbi:hypothetical protein [Nesterenkonia flava]|uniref:Uncharacterized protein n=1 Tax=Nesterenkonia flava TaxID=469799 RepID=A0ABU1FQS4_9MICC|nr:hypothetical protein [Nesterenkonia flava]MDR5710994.1 hypothetical protein [Nesterenkonia flava]